MLSHREDDSLTTIEDKKRIEAVYQFATNVLLKGRDKYRDNPSPLFADGINVHTDEHVKWKFPGGREAVMSNLASQQNLLRTLVGLSNLTGDLSFKNAAKEAIEYHFKYLQDSEGLMQWGGHRFIDLITLNIDGAEEKGGMVHELKNHFPFYELMYEVNPEATAKYIKAVWNAHIYDWKSLELSRHGQYGLKLGKLWDSEFENREPFSETVGLSFLNAGNDLIYAAGILYKLSKDEGALRWGKRLAEQYVKARDEKTGLGVYQFTKPRKAEHCDDDSNTLSKFGDRAGRQLGPEFGKAALEGKMLLQRHAETIYSESALMQLQLAREIGEEAKEMLKWTEDGMLSYYNNAYIKKINKFRPMLTDGTDLSDFVLKRNGYYGKAGTVLGQYSANSKFLLSYVRAFISTGHSEFWTLARAIAKAYSLGEIGILPGKDVDLNLGTENDDARVLFSVIDMYKYTENEGYLKLARVIGNNIVRNKYFNGYFMPGKEYVNASFDAVEPLALLYLDAAIEGDFDKVPYFIDGSGFFHGDYEFEDGQSKSAKSQMLFEEKIK
jgi:pectate lyase